MLDSAHPAPFSLLYTSFFDTLPDYVRQTAQKLPEPVPVLGEGGAVREAAMVVRLPFRFSQRVDDCFLECLVVPAFGRCVHKHVDVLVCGPVMHGRREFGPNPFNEIYLQGTPGQQGRDGVGAAQPRCAAHRA